MLNLLYKSDKTNDSAKKWRGGKKIKTEKKRSNLLVSDRAVKHDKSIFLAVMDHRAGLYVFDLYMGNNEILPLNSDTKELETP